MFYLTNNISNMVIAFFGTTTFLFITRFFQQLGEELPKLDNIVNSPGSLQVAIYSLLGALITFFLKQANSIKNIENSTKNTETHLQKMTENQKEVAELLKSGNEISKKMAIMQKESLKGRSTESLVRRLPNLFEEDEE
jgi:hypothetical protein